MVAQPAAGGGRGAPAPGIMTPGARGGRMSSGRLEAFSDGVIAIIITIMVLELHVPHGADAPALLTMAPMFLNYLLSYVYVGIYWNNHHHMLQTAERIDGPVLWANLHLLFWLSLFPFATAWMGEHAADALPCAVYGAVLLLAAVAYWILQQRLIAAQGEGSLLRRAVGGDWKGKLSPLLYLLGIAAAFRAPRLAQGMYVLVAALWLVPDRRIESLLARTDA